MTTGITRRGLIAAAAASLAVTGEARALGLPAGPDLERAMTSLAGIGEGHGPGTLHVLFAPWCHVSPDLYRASRGVLGHLTIRWIPFSGGQPEGKEATEILLRNMEPSLVPAAFSPLRPSAVRLPTPLCDAQDATVARSIEPLVIRDTGRALATPTMVYRFRDGRVRVVPGGVTAEQLRIIAGLAS